MADISQPQPKLTQILGREEAVTPQTVKEAPAAVKEETVQVAPVSALEKIYFDFDSYRVSEAARSILAKDAGVMKKDSAVKVRIEGNCDERGSDEYNLALGEKRAEAAKRYLVTMGISADRLSVISYGKEKPVDPGHDEAAWAKNRRDDFIIIK